MVSANADNRAGHMGWGWGGSRGFFPFLLFVAARWEGGGGWWWQLVAVVGGGGWWRLVAAVGGAEWVSVLGGDCRGRCSRRSGVSEWVRRLGCVPGFPRGGF